MIEAEKHEPPALGAEARPAPAAAGPPCSHVPRRPPKLHLSPPGREPPSGSTRGVDARSEPGEGGRSYQ